MAFIDWIALWLLGFAFGGGFTKSLAAIVDNQNHVQFQCSFTRYPHLCVQTLMDSNHTSVDMMMSVLVNKTMGEIDLPSSFFRTSSSQIDMQDAHLRDQPVNIGGNLLFSCIIQSTLPFLSWNSIYLITYVYKYVTCMCFEICSANDFTLRKFIRN